MDAAMDDHRPDLEQGCVAHQDALQPADGLHRKTGPVGTGSAGRVSGRRGGAAELRRYGLVPSLSRRVGRRLNVRLDRRQLGGHGFQASKAHGRDGQKRLPDFHHPWRRSHLLRGPGHCAIHNPAPLRGLVAVALDPEPGLAQCNGERLAKHI
jgi:hypothetical protein